MRCTDALRKQPCYGRSGTELGYGATRAEQVPLGSLEHDGHLYGLIPYLPTPPLGRARTRCSRAGFSCACPPRTRLSRSMRLRAGYALPATHLPYAATRPARSSYQTAHYR
eukprot:2775907-Rhodomonas_salina.1